MGIQYVLRSGSNWASAVKDGDQLYVPSNCCSLKLAQMESSGGIRGDGYFIMEVGLILLCVQWSCLPLFFIKPRTPLSWDYCSTLDDPFDMRAERRKPIGYIGRGGRSLKFIAYYL